MNILSNMFSSNVNDVIKSVSSGLDDLFTSDEEKLAAKNVMEKIKQQSEIHNKEFESQFEKEISNRNQFDQTHGNFLTKSVRPIFLYWLMGLDTIIFIGGMSGFNISPEYVEFIKTLNMTAVTFFFGSKGIEIYKHGKLV